MLLRKASRFPHQAGRVGPLSGMAFFMEDNVKMMIRRLSNVPNRIGSLLGSGLAVTLPAPVLHGLGRRVCQENPDLLLESIGPIFNRSPDLEHMPLDLPRHGQLEFEDLAGLFASNSLNHGVVSMTIRQTAYLFGLVRRMPARRVIEVGRYKGGSTLAIAAAMQPEGQFWSIDIGEKERRLRRGHVQLTYDQQIKTVFPRLGLNVHLIIGDSRNVELNTGEVDLVFIDGDHSYEGVKNDFDRFGRRVRVGGAVLLDDAFDEWLFRTHSDTVGRLVEEVVQSGEFRLARVIDRLAHLERLSVG